MRIGINELEEILESQEEENKKRFDALEELIKSLGGMGIKVPESSQSPSLPQQSTSPSNSEKSEEEKWEDFFKEKGITDQNKKTLWKETSGLALDEVQTVWENGWEDLTEETGGITDLKNKYATYTSKDSKKETTEGVSLLKHTKKSLNMVHQTIFDMRKANKYALPTDEQIKKIVESVKVPGSNNYKVPNSRNYDALIKIRDNRIKELFKEKFGSDVSDDIDVDAWRSTGLGGNGTDERKAFNNGWTNPKEIKDGKVASYTTNINKITITTNNIDVLVINKNQLKEAHDLLSGIKATEGFKELIAWKEANKARIGALKNDQLPEDNLTAIKARKLWDNNLDDSDIKEDNGDIKVIDPKTKESIIGYDNIIKLGAVEKDEVVEDESAPTAIDPIVAKSEISEENIAWRRAMGGVATGSRNQALDGTGKTEADNIIMDKWFALTEMGGGKIASGKQRKNIEQAAKIHRLTFFFRINEAYNEKEGDGLTDDDWKLALEKEDNDLKDEPRGKLDSATFNKFLTDNDIDLPTDKANETSDMTEWLKKKGGFDIKDEPAEDYIDKSGNPQKGVNTTWDSDDITVVIDGNSEIIKKKTKLNGKQLLAIEELWDLTAKGGLLLPYSLQKIGWHTDNIFNPDKMTFCKWEEAKIKVKKRIKDGINLKTRKPKWKTIENEETMKVVNDSSLSDEDRLRIFGDAKKMPGHVPLVTGGGKTTKCICCMVRGGEKNVVLVCPDKGLAQSAFKNHSSWLQYWGCVIHKKNPQIVTQEVVKKDEKTGKKTKSWEKVIRYDSHGSYQVKLNDVITKQVEMSDKDEEGRDKPGTKKPRWGVSILDPGYFFGFSTRNVFTTKQKGATKSGVSLLEAAIGKSKIMLKEGEVAPDITEEVIKEIRTKKLPKNAIIVFDEGDLGESDYQELIKDTIFAGYDVIKKSALFKGLPFSITTTFPRKNLYMNYIPAKYIENEVEINFDEKLAASRTQVFLKDVKNVNVSSLLAKNIPHIVINESNRNFYESITHGLPDGSLVIVSGKEGRGYTPNIDISISPGWTQYPILKSDWTYTDPQPDRISLASAVQEIGRPARIKDGTAIILFKLDELVEPTSQDEVSVFVIRAALTGDAEALKGITFGKDINLLRACISFPGDSDAKKGKFGLPPEVLVMGAAGAETLNEVKVKFHRDMGTHTPDKTLLAKHRLEWTPLPLDERESHEILKLMVQTYIEEDKEFPNKLEVKVKTPLIGELDQGQDPETKGPGNGKFKLKVEEIRQILHTVVKSRLVDADSELATNPKKLQWPATEEETFNRVVAIHKLALGAGIDIPSRDVDPDDTEKGKELVVEVNYPEPVLNILKKAIFGVYDEETERLKEKIRHVLKEANLNHLDEVKEAFEEDTLEGYEILAIELRTAPLCNRLVNEIGTNRANSLVFELNKIIEEINLNEFEANIEVKTW